MRKRLARLLVRAYPEWWRDRYGSEYEALLEDVPARPREVADVLAAAVSERLRQPTPGGLAPLGGPIMTFDLGGRYSRTFAWLALLVAAPTTVFLALNSLAYNLNVTSLMPLVDRLQPLVDVKIIGLYLMGAPALAFLLALLPVLRFSIHRDEAGQFLLSFVVRGRLLNLLALGLALVLVAFFAGHFMAEYLFGT
jgi:hypothetical protein